MRRINGDIDRTTLDVIGLSLDYDGSAGPPSGSGDHFPLSEELLTFAHELLTDTNAELWIYDGSLRNSRYINELNRRGNNNGCCFQHQIRFVETLQTRYPEFADRIKLIKLTAEDIHLGAPEGFCFDDVINMSPLQRAMLFNERPEPCIPWLDDNKHAIHYLQLQHLRKHSKKPLLVFTDDRLTIHQSSRRLFSETHPEWVPCDTAFQHILFVHRQFIEATQFPLIMGHGIVDNHYSETVKLLHDPIAAELSRHQKKSIEELLSVVENPTTLLPNLLKSHILNDVICLIDSVPEDRKSVCYTALLHVALEENNLHVLTQLVQKITPEQRLSISTEMGRSLFFLAARARNYDLLRALIKDQNPKNERFIEAYYEVFRMACGHSNVELITILSPYSPSLADDLLGVATRAEWDLFETIIKLPCNAESTFALSTVVALIPDTLQAMQWTIAQHLLLHCHDLTASQKACLSNLVNINQSSYNSTSLTKTSLQHLLALAPTSTSATLQHLHEFNAQIAILEGDAFTEKMFHALFFIAINLPPSKKDSVDSLFDMLILHALLVQQESRRIIAERDTLFNDLKNWDSIIQFLHTFCTDYALILHGNIDALEPEKIMAFILGQLPHDKPDHINENYVRDILQKMPTIPVKNAEHLTLIDEHFHQHALRNNKICINAHRALRFIIASIDASDSLALTKALAHFNAAKTIGDPTKTNREILTEFDIEQKAKCSAIFCHPTSYNRLIKRLKTVGADCHAASEPTIATPVH